MNNADYVRVNVPVTDAGRRILEWYTRCCLEREARTKVWLVEAQTRAWLDTSETEKEPEYEGIVLK